MWLKEEEGEKNNNKKTKPDIQFNIKFVIRILPIHTLGSRKAICVGLFVTYNRNHLKDDVPHYVCTYVRMCVYPFTIYVYSFAVKKDQHSTIYDHSDKS